MTRKGPVATKDLRVHPVEDYPYMLTKKNQMPSEARYFRSFREARAQMVKDLDAIRFALVDRLNVQDAAVAIYEAKSAVDRIPDTGGSICQVVDPYTGIKYQAVLVDRRKA
jgi:hypothetical protein